MSVLRSTGVLAFAVLVAVSVASPGHANGDHNPPGNAIGLSIANSNGVDFNNPFAAGEYHRQNGAVNVPEIDAASGLAALAVILAGLALAWERRRRYV